MPITAPSRGSSARSRSRRAFRRRSPRVIPLPLPLPTERPPRCVWDTKPVLPHQEDVPISATSPLDNGLSSASSYYYGGDVRIAWAGTQVTEREQGAVPSADLRAAYDCEL